MSGHTYTVCRCNAATECVSNDTALAQCEQNASDSSPDWLAYNGNDALFLLQGSRSMPTNASGHVVVDTFGYAYESGAVGSGFIVCGVSAQDATFVRKAAVVSGATNFSLSAGTGADDCQWIAHERNTLSFVGNHECILPVIKATFAPTGAPTIAESAVVAGAGSTAAAATTVGVSGSGAGAANTDGADDNSKTNIYVGVGIGAGVLLVLIVLIVFYLSRSSGSIKGGASDGVVIGKSGFDNPMYDSEAGDTSGTPQYVPAYDMQNSKSNPLYATGGQNTADDTTYMEVTTD